MTGSQVKQVRTTAVRASMQNHFIGNGQAHMPGLKCYAAGRPSNVKGRGAACIEQPGRHTFFCRSTTWACRAAPSCLFSWPAGPDSWCFCSLACCIPGPMSCGHARVLAIIHLDPIHMCAGHCAEQKMQHCHASQQDRLTAPPKVSDLAHNTIC